MTDVVDELLSALGDRVVTDAATIDAHRRDSWMLSELHDFEERAGPRPLAVVAAATTADVSKTLMICRNARTPVIPFGGARVH